MGYNPWINAAKAAYAEVSSDEAIAFIKATALSHTLLVAFYALEAVYWTVEAGRLTRRFVDSFSIPEEAPTTAVVIAGLLPPAQDEPPITTEAVITNNQQKLEQYIENTIKGIYDHEFCTEIDPVGDSAVQQVSEQTVEPDQGHLLLSVEGSPSNKPKKSASPRQRKPRGSAASGNGRQGSNKPNPEGRVSGTGSRVQGKRHTKNVDV